MSIRIFKLITGEEFVGYLVEETAEQVVIENPVVGMPDGKGGMELVPYAPYFNLTKGETRILPLKSAQVMFHATIINEMKFIEDAYAKHFGKVLTV